MDFYEIIHFESVTALQLASQPSQCFNCIPLTDFTLITKGSVIMRFSVYSQRYMHSITSDALNFGLFCGFINRMDNN